MQQLLLTPFSGVQLALIIIVSLVCVALFAGNTFLIVLFYRKRKRKKMLNAALQAQRDGLLQELDDMRKGIMPQPVVQEKAVGQPVFAEAAETAFADESEAIGISDFDEEEEVSAPVGSPAFAAEILAVSDMSDLMRERFGFVGEEYDNKRYYIRKSVSFEAKLRSSSDEVKQYYMRVMSEFKRYSGINSKLSFRRERVYTGRKTLALVLFKGKKLCVAFALDPAEYANTKYRGEDLSAKKNLAGTPMLMRITSQRRLGYVLYLISQLAALNGSVVDENAVKPKFDLAKRSRDRLFAENKYKITVVGEAPELKDNDDEEESASVRASILAVKDMSELMRQKFGFVGEEYNGKKYYVRYNYSFEAKLTGGSEDVKKQYTSIIGQFKKYSGVNNKRSFRRERVYAGRKTLALMQFRGKKLCIALALDPAGYEETKYRGEDVSYKKSFANTPMLIKITSARKLKYVTELISQLAEKCGLELGAQPEELQCNLTPKNNIKLFAENKLKITVIGEALQGTEN